MKHDLNKLTDESVKQLVATMSDLFHKATLLGRVGGYGTKLEQILIYNKNSNGGA